jgi:hypothetical protein
MSTITLGTRDTPYEIPSYSLTGDVLGYLRCGLQYRYSRIGKMPSRNPVQLWFGHFVHGCMDEGFRRYKVALSGGAGPSGAMAAVDPELIIPFVQERLKSQGILANDPWLRLLGFARARVALLDLGPHLFPLVSLSEVRLTGTRGLAALPADKVFRRADRYEMAGVIDVVSDVEMAVHGGNPVVANARGKLGTLPPHFELIVDYKGSRRQANVASVAGAVPSLWDQYAWQLLTYAELRSKQVGSKPVAGGILIYINELLPLVGDFDDLEREISGFTTRSGVTHTTDEPVPRAEIAAWRDAARLASDAAEAEQEALRSAENPDADLIASRRLGTIVPFDIRLRRALRVIANEDTARETSLQGFDATVYKIECHRGDEFHGKSLLDSWPPNPEDESTCAACDTRTWCPAFQQRYAGGRQSPPPSPKVKNRP